MQDCNSVKTDGWSDEKAEILERLWPAHSAREISHQIGKSRSAVLGKARRLGLEAKGAGKRSHVASRDAQAEAAWPAEKVAKLRELWSNHPTSVIASWLSKSVNSVCWKANQIGLPAKVRRHPASTKPVLIVQTGPRRSWGLPTTWRPDSEHRIPSLPKLKFMGEL